jgi:hypothetical protein
LNKIILGKEGVCVSEIQGIKTLREYIADNTSKVSTQPQRGPTPENTLRKDVMSDEFHQILVLCG